ncbi:Isoleucine--tRNA ligase, mitochondrial [Chionoecetes opilio]|uniref:Isoleucine--tRNA ligase, mitochondrial n=1 Tax=Chionoecetes opilio TaxID=41210 RepID=A0A8J5CJ17_CHIOP|nr:Isoleucine--tRNA ligase, mitochondrial [Chionoecetes opilio]
MLYVHGFALDEHGRKMSKSLGNVVDPQEVTDGGADPSKNPAYGADVLRWWVGSHAADHSTMTIGQQHLEQGRDSVQKLRAVLRFLLASLQDYQPCQHSLPVQDLRPIDRYMLHLLHAHIQKVGLPYALYTSECCTNFVTYVGCSRLPHHVGTCQLLTDSSGLFVCLMLLIHAYF